jgi:hypothetical protein
VKLARLVVTANCLHESFAWLSGLSGTLLQ